MMMAFKPKNKASGSTAKKQEKKEEEMQQVAPPMMQQVQQPQYQQPPMYPQPPVQQIARPVIPQQNKFSLAEITTETGMAIQDTETGENFDVMSALVWIMNKLNDIEEAAVGEEE